MGLLGVSSSGGEATILVDSAGDLPIYYCNAVELGSNGTVYFTDASQVYRNTTLMIANKDATGRLLKYEPTTGQVSVLASGLAGPTGLTISSDGSYLLFNEMVSSTIIKYYLSGTSANTQETLTTSIYQPANIRRGQIGDYFYLPQTPIPYVHYMVKIDSTGNVLENTTIAGPYSKVIYFRDVRQVGLGFSFYIGSRYAPFVGLKLF
ncbi:hypothetical protein MLD38_017672 [Melastoma candidum]|uniref:Uncharacterized protein n=1 Tax=Melastoma candidum TaxID=119954 RepID=A0ACB9QVF8_9MYRT|nr:hypothetical protein MLD38_017672 [Melastoma candidum]